MDIITYALAKGKSGGGGGVSQIQSDWNQNDETKVDYIKNKPLYKTEEGTVQIYDKKILNADGTIPIELFPNNVINNKFELWTDLTLEEDVRTVSVSQTDDGRPLKIKELFVYFYGKFNIDASVFMSLQTGVFYQCWTPLKASGDKVNAFWVYCKKVGDGTYFSIYPETQIINQIQEDGGIQGLVNANKATKCDIAHHSTVKTASNFVFGSSNANFKMLASSHIMAWGVMDDE